MKKIICAVLSLVLVFALASCGKKDDGTLVAYKDDEGNLVTEYREEPKNDGKDENNIDDEVKITIPLVFIDEKFGKDIEAYCKANSFTSGEINEKEQTATITMRALTYDLNLVRIGTQVMSSIGNTIDSGEYPYVKNIESYSDNFDEIVMLVDGEGYKADKQGSLLAYFIGECGMFYQVYTTENEYECTVKLKDEKSGEIIFEKTYKTDNKGREY